jgi:endonuclease/exonuclease/phosphatase family metal-dependent hydrolase
MIRQIFYLLAILTLIMSPARAGDNTITHAPMNQDRDLRILSWNIYMLPPIAPVVGRVDRAHAIVDTLRHSEFDIIVFQEAFNHFAVSVIRDSLKAIYPYMYGPFNPSHSPFRISSGVWVISKIPLDLKSTIEYKIAKETDRVAHKGAALLEGAWNGKKFQLIGTHLQAQNHPDIRRLQIRHMYDSLITKYRIEGVPQIICGDMNTEIEIQKNYRDMLKGLDAEDGSITGAQQMTYDGTNNALALSVWKKDKTTLDYILLRRNGSKANVIDRHVSVFKRVWKKGHNDLSDHYAMACEVKF